MSYQMHDWIHLKRSAGDWAGKKVKVVSTRPLRALDPDTLGLERCEPVTSRIHSGE